jgi:ligand-binding sensor domain-containing protein/serine phosphatase RsbU (regulator of sigma subunit)
MRLFTSLPAIYNSFYLTAENRKVNCREPQSKISESCLCGPQRLLSELCGKKEIVLKLLTSGISKFKLVVLFFIFSSYAFSQDYNYRNFNSEDGLTQSYVYSIVQDVHGYLWICTDDGLFRYDGFKFENIPITDTLADSYVTRCVSDGESVWFGHYNGGLSYYDGKKIQTFKISQINSQVTYFAKSPDGGLWASTYYDGLFELDNDVGVAKHSAFKDKTTIISFSFITENEILVGTNSGLLYCKLSESGEIDIIQTVSEIPVSKITGIRQMRNKSGFFIVTENDGIFQLKVHDKELGVKKINANTEFDFTGLQDVYEDSRSDLWLCSKGNGLIKASYSESGNLSNPVFFNRAAGFVSDNVQTVFEDREGNIWSGNFGHGLTLITPKTFAVEKIINPVFGSSIFSIFFNQKFKWIGTENGLIKIDQLTGKPVKFYGTGNGLPKDTVTSIYSKDGNDFWIGTGKHGVFRMDAEMGKILKYPIENGVLENSITVINGRGDLVWIGTKKGLWSINTGNNEKKWYSINKGGLPHNSISSLFIDSKDKLWVTTPSSILSYIQDGKIIKIPLNSPKGNLTLGPITEDTDSRIWVGSNGNGVFIIQPDSIANLTMKEGLLSNFCYSLKSDNQNNIWVGHRGGLSRIRTTDFSIKPVRNFDGSTDTYHFNLNAVFKDSFGKIWFGSDKGIVSYDPSVADPLKSPPVLGITSIRINDEVVEISDRIILPPGNYKIRIDFLGINLKEPGLVNYQYMLEGYDQWSEISKNTFITFPRITEGNYKFILKASSGEGEVTKTPVTIDFTVKKFLWKRWWFYPGIILLIFTFTFIFIKRHIHLLQTDKRKLEAKIVERTSEIQFQKDEIELQRDLIDEKNENITSSIKYARHIQNAVLPPLEFINKLLPGNFILSRPKDIVSGDFYWLAEKDNKVVFTVADCTGHGVPGAFMSLLGITLLNEIVNIHGILSSDAIISRLRERIIQCLQQSRKEITTSDGMDMALCVLDRKKNKIQFTGGMSDLVYVRESELFVVKGDRTSICASDTCSGIFTMKEIDVKKGDVFYLFSDGFQDQFGGDHDKKYLSRKFYSSLLEIHELPMLKQKEVLEIKFNEWMKDYVQTDDITVMGIRL